MIYNSRKYPPSLFVINPYTNISNKGFLVIYTKNKIKHMGKLTGYSLKGVSIINTNWLFAETIECIPNNEITHISKYKLD